MALPKIFRPAQVIPLCFGVKIDLVQLFGHLHFTRWFGMVVEPEGLDAGEEQSHSHQKIIGRH